jgi:predicted RNA-binding protein YlxR (DUF448 family)
MTMSPEISPKTNARTCVGCGKPDARDVLVRVVAADEQVVVDLAGGSFGRGAHVHPAPACIEAACRHGFSKAFKRSMKMDAKALAEQIGAAADRRIEGLILGARRAGHLAMGADAAAAALDEGAELLVVAADAGTVASRAVFTRAVGDGRAVVLSNKARLGALLGREEIAVFAVTQAGIAAELRRVRAFADRARSVSWSSREVQ